MRTALARFVVVTACATSVLAPLANAAASGRLRAAITLSTVYRTYGPTDLLDVTCPTAALCLAIGDEPANPMITGIYRNSMYSLLYRSTDGGATWTETPTPGGVYANSYDWEEASVSVSCGSPTFCVLEYVGVEGDAPSDIFEVSTDGGLTWTLAPAEFYVDQGATGMTGLTCITSSTCVGIIDGHVASTTNLAASWTVHRTSNVDAISCPSATSCDVLESTAVKNTDSLVVARTTNLGATTVPVLQLHGTRWQETPELSCATPLACVVIVPTVQDPQFARTTNGGRTWSIANGPLYDQRPEGLDCTTPHDCVLLANDPDFPSKVDSYATTDGGADWSNAVTIWELGFPGASPALTCTGTQCEATLGTRSVFSLDVADLALTSWTASHENPSPPELTTVGCQSDGSCLALGPGVLATSLDDGTTWSVQSDPSLAEDSFGSLTCPLPSTCFVGGDSSATGGFLLVTADLGADWTAATLPWEVQTAADVQCNAAGICLALPDIAINSTHVPTFVLRSTDGGADWALVQLAAAGTHLVLTGVACPTSTDCVAVGTTPAVAAVETSSDGGATWSAVDPTAGGFGGLSEFHGLACASATNCETATTSVGTHAIEVDAWGTADAGATWSKLGAMLDIPIAGYASASPTMSSCSSGGVCVGLTDAIVGPERPGYFDAVLATTSGGASWDTEIPDVAYVGMVTVAANGNVIALAYDAEDGNQLLVGSP